MCQNVWKECCEAIRIHLLPFCLIPHILGFDASLEIFGSHVQKLLEKEEGLMLMSTDYE